MIQSGFSYNGNNTHSNDPNPHRDDAANTVTWTKQDQKILEEGLAMYRSGCAAQRYAKIALMLRNKSIRDVAIRVKWMASTA